MMIGSFWELGLHKILTRVAKLIKQTCRVFHGDADDVGVRVMVTGADGKVLMESRPADRPMYLLG